MVGKHGLRIFAIILLVTALSGSAILSVMAGIESGVSQSDDLPPRATMIPPPTTEPVQPPPVATVTQSAAPKHEKKDPVLGNIQLEARFNETLPVKEYWTVVEWSDGMGNWYVVEGWRGGFDAFELTDTWVAKKIWWVAKKDLGTGPFRWAVYRVPDGPLLAMSEPFDLPAKMGESVVVELVLEP